MKMSVMLLLNFEGEGPGFSGAFMASKFLKNGFVVILITFLAFLYAVL